MSTEIVVRSVIKGVEFDMKVVICDGSIRIIFGEIHSPDNYRGAQRAYGVHEPTCEQLLDNYIRTGGLQRCINDLPRLAVASIQQV
jgi:hypothetical protein